MTAHHHSAWPLSRVATLLALLLVPAPVWAHPGHGAHADFVQGLLHPASGIDHVLVMLGVGLFAALLGGKALWRLPLAFLAAMALSATAAAWQYPLPGIEMAIAATVLLMGLLLARGKPVSLALAMPLVAVFACVHGQAHGAEIPANAAGIAYGAGFLVATAVLHAAGALGGLALARIGQSRSLAFTRLVGAGMSAAGVVLLVVG
jgi:urease accessory protein